MAMRWNMLDLKRGTFHVIRRKDGRPSMHLIRGDKIRALRRVQRDQPTDCTRGRSRALKLPPRAEHEALKAARGQFTTEGGPRRYARRAGIEGTLSQGVRAFGPRRSRYHGLAMTHLQHVATAAAVNLARLG